jgi:hypothetical protein
MKKSPYIRAGLKQGSYTGGWLDLPNTDKK